MHVLILPSWYPRYEGDPGGSFFRDQAHGLADAGVKVGVVFSDLRGPKSYFRGSRRAGISVKQDGPVAEIRSHGFNWFPRNMDGFEWLWRRHADKALSVYFKRFGMPDVVHAHSMEPAASVAAHLHHRYGIPFIITEHSTFHIRDLGSARVKRKCAKLARTSAANLAVSEVFAHKLNRIYGGNWRYLPNIVGSRFLSHPLITPCEGELRLVSIALLARHKRMDLVVEAVAYLRDRGWDAALTIIGDGPERQSLEQQVASLGLTNKIKFAGLVAAFDMPTALANGHLLVSASEFETFGVTLIEGMALGMPVVATRSGGPDSIVTPAVGKLVDEWSATAIADAVESIMNNIDHFQPAKLRAFCAARYSAPVISDALKAIYAEVTANVA